MCYPTFTKNILSICVLSFFIESCSVTLPEKAGNDLNLTNKSLHLLSGKYFNNSIDEKYKIWTQLTGRSVAIDPLNDDAIIEIKISKNKICEIFFHVNDSIRDQATLNVKYASEGYLKLKNQSSFDFKYVLIWTYGNSGISLGLTKEKNLIIANSNTNNVFLVVFPFGGAEYSWKSEYERVNQ